jgi:site-specific DNA-cytosine methylase
MSVPSTALLALPSRLRVLVACEFSGTVRDSFRALGHDAMSCDLLPTEKPGPHYQGDVRDLLTPGRWDLMIAHPPCTYLSVSGMHWTRRGMRDPQLTEDALDFVRLLLAAPVSHIALENPVSIISSRVRKPDQIIQPWMFGHDASKKTCLWLKGLPPLRQTKIVEGRLVCCGQVLEARRRYGNQCDSGQNRLAPSSNRWKERSRTFPGVGKAMAAQWSEYLANAANQERGNNG